MKEKYDISFLKDYLKLKGISQTALAKYLGITKQYISLLLNGNGSINQNHLNKLLELFNVESYDKLIKLVNNNKSESIENLNIDSDIKKNDISFLKDYLKLKGISQTALAKYLGITNAYISLLLNGNGSINQNHLNKLLELFNVESYDKLIELVNNDKSESIENLNIDSDIKKYDISFLKDYLKLKRISQTDFANSICMSQQYLNHLINGYQNISDNFLNRILNYFNIESYEKLKEYCYLNGERKYELLNLMMMSEILSNKIDNELLKNYLYNTPLNININFNELLDIIKDYTLNDNYMEVIILLFNDKYNLSINEIASITQVNQIDITKILRDSIMLYIEKHYDDYNDNNNLKVLKKLH